MDPLFSPKVEKEKTFNDKFTEIMDVACVARNSSQAPRKYLGASRWGGHCERALGYEYHQTPKDEGAEFKGKTIRIFDMGHDGEERMAEYMQLSGFKVKTHKEDGKQFGFSAAEGRLKGHIDGVIIEGPDMGHKWPALWESKALGKKSFTDVLKQGIKESKPVYWAQAQIYMAYLDLAWCLFTCINRDSGEVYAEVIMFDQPAAQKLSDKAVRIVATQNPEELSKASHDPSNFGCMWCDYKKRCHQMFSSDRFSTTKTETDNSIPSWLK